jgi:hypothetical protein
LVVLFLAALAGLAPVEAAPSSCIACHAQLDGATGETARLWERDVHGIAGLGCESCHGGDPSPALAEDSEAAMTPKRGFAPAPKRLEIPEFCGRCHADPAFMKRYDPQVRVDQLAEYRTSVHGKRNREGDPRPATCIDCHGAHGIRPVDVPDSPVYATHVPETCGRCHADAKLMAPYGIRTDQLAQYKRSVHAGALLERGDVAAPACNDCHGNHGAAPPGIQSVAFVCGQCHGREAALFGASIKKELFQNLEQAECTVCHDHHDVSHPTPELFHGGSAAEVSTGTIRERDPLVAEIGDLASGQKASATWRVVVHPHLTAGDARLAHVIEIAAGGMAPLELDATVRPGESPDGSPPRRASAGPLTAGLTIVPLAGSPVEAGDALLLRLELQATAAAPAVRIRDLPQDGIDPIVGSVCLTCHSPGDPCDQASEKMYAALGSLERDLRQASALLRRAEIAGMEVSRPRFELKSKGTTAAVEARALIHTFDPPRLLKRIEDGTKVASSALAAGESALAELQYRRKGLAVSLVLIGFVLAGLFFKIRQVDRRTTSLGDAGGQRS